MDCTWIGAQLLLNLPIIGDQLMWVQAAPANPASMKKLMNDGKNLCILPGGFQEATVCKYGEHIVYMKKRKGLIKYCLRYGYNMYPVYTFGEERLYYTLTAFEKFRIWLSEFNFPGAVFVSSKFWWCFPFMPNNDVELTTIVGKPIQLPKIENPSNEEVDKWHSAYMERLQEHFEEYKKKYAYDKEKKLLVV